MEPASREEWFGLLSDYVRNALNERLQARESAQFNSLLYIFEDFSKADKRAQAKATVEALTLHVSLVDRDKHEALLNKVYGTSFWLLGADIVEALCDLTVSLVSACPACLADCLSVLVSYFLPPTAADLPVVDAVSLEPVEPRPQRLVVMQAVHTALAKIVDLVPGALPVVQHVILQRMPHKHMSKETHQQYLHNMFKVAELPQAGTIREGLLLGVIGRLLEVDVEIKYEDLDDLEDVVEDEDAEALFDFEDASRGTPQASPPLSHRPLDETADKLDGMMDIVFSHFGRRITAGDFDSLLQTLLRALQTSLLQTYKSKFTQFLVFYVCSRDNEMRGANMLCDVLFERLSNVAHPSILRVAAASYMASFLARGSFLSSAFVLQRLSQLCAWASSFLDRYEEAVAVGDVSGQSQDVFDAVCQAVLYVLCYRMEAIADSGKVPLVEMRSLPLERLLNHALQPLRACAPAIAHEYSRRAKQLRMPGRSAARAVAALHNVDQPSATRSSRQTRPLDTFFPFDPYLLRASSAQLDLKRCYIRWQASDAAEHEGYASDGPSEASGMDERSGSQAADDSFRDAYGVAMHVGLAKPAPLVMAMSYEEAAVLSGSSFGGLSLQ